jgi:hypothetical protein
MRSARYQYPEYLSSTDSFLIAVRKLFAEHARGVERTVEVHEETTAEKLVYEADRQLGIPTGAATIVQTAPAAEEPEYLEVLRMTRTGGRVNR